MSETRAKRGRRMPLWDAIDIAKRNKCEYCLAHILAAERAGRKTVLVASAFDATEHVVA